MNELLKNINSWLSEKKAIDIKNYDVREYISYTKDIVICSGDNSVHSRAIADYLLGKAKEGSLEIYSKEGLGSGNWILIDFVDIVVHIMVASTRKYYALEELWEHVKRGDK